MILVLKITSLAIWFIIMLFTIKAVFARKRSLRDINQYLYTETLYAPKFKPEQDEGSQ